MGFPSFISRYLFSSNELRTVHKYFIRRLAPIYDNQDDDDPDYDDDLNDDDLDDDDLDDDNVDDDANIVGRNGPEVDINDVIDDSGDEDVSNEADQESNKLSPEGDESSKHKAETNDNLLDDGEYFNEKMWNEDDGIEVFFQNEVILLDSSRFQENSAAEDIVSRDDSKNTELIDDDDTLDEDEFDDDSIIDNDDQRSENMSTIPSVSPRMVDLTLSENAVVRSSILDERSRAVNLRSSKESDVFHNAGIIGLVVILTILLVAVFIALIVSSAQRSRKRRQKIKLSPTGVVQGGNTRLVEISYATI